VIKLFFVSCKSASFLRLRRFAQGYKEWTVEVADVTIMQGAKVW